MIITMCAALHVRIANRVVKGSRCRGGIVNTRGGCSRARSVRPESSTALWRFRASTSNSLSGRTWPPTYTHLCHIHHTYVQQDIRVYEDDRISAAQSAVQIQSQGAFASSRKYLRHLEMTVFGSFCTRIPYRQDTAFATQYFTISRLP